jgi:hypothetical protein
MLESPRYRLAVCVVIVTLSQLIVSQIRTRITFLFVSEKRDVNRNLAVTRRESKGVSYWSNSCGRATVQYTGLCALREPEERVIKYRRS